MFSNSDLPLPIAESDFDAARAKISEPDAKLRSLRRDDQRQAYSAFKEMGSRIAKDVFKNAVLEFDFDTSLSFNQNLALLRVLNLSAKETDNKPITLKNTKSFKLGFKRTNAYWLTQASRTPDGTHGFLHRCISIVPETKPEKIFTEILEYESAMERVSQLIKEIPRIGEIGEPLSEPNLGLLIFEDGLKILKSLEGNPDYKDFYGITLSDTRTIENPLLPDGGIRIFALSTLGQTRTILAKFLPQAKRLKQFRKSTVQIDDNCSGVVISKNLIATAAHCVMNNYTDRGGLVDLFKKLPEAPGSRGSWKELPLNGEKGKLNEKISVRLPLNITVFGERKSFEPKRVFVDSEFFSFAKSQEEDSIAPKDTFDRAIIQVKGEISVEPVFLPNPTLVKRLNEKLEKRETVLLLASGFPDERWHPGELYRARSYDNVFGGDNFDKDFGLAGNSIGFRPGMSGGPTFLFDAAYFEKRVMMGIHTSSGSFSGDRNAPVAGIFELTVGLNGKYEDLVPAWQFEN